MNSKINMPFISPVTLNIIIICILLSASSFNIWNQSKVDVQQLISTVKESVNLLGSRTIENKNILQDMLNNPPKTFNDTEVPIHYYPERDEYGFNNTIHKDILLNGTLLGMGKPPQSLLEKNYLFPYLDRAWSRSSPLLLSTDQFYTSYEYHFIYAMKNRTQGRTSSQSLDVIKPSRYFSKAGSPDIAKKQLQTKGFYITDFYGDAIDSAKVMSIVSPVYHNGSHVGDMGIDIPKNYFLALNNLPPLIQKYANVSIHFNQDSDPLYFTHKEQASSAVLFRKKFHVSNLATIYLSIPPAFILHSLWDKLPVIALLLFLFNLLYFNIAKSKKEKYILHTQTITDDLTGIFNRRIIDQVLSEIEYSENNKNAFTLVVLDADKFKDINDYHGHLIGDEALKHIADTLKDNTRKNDLCIRMGGDEFCVVLFNTPQVDAEKVAHSLKDKIDNTPINQDGIMVKISYGISQQQGNESFDETYKRADMALYKNKKENNSEDNT
ncbi:GGDEF domain-containing protein [Vibrio rumoiensis]|uniref:diguanylate cyclase n=1 Tax=Vibrio rumoiensis 1S-45 TaxID=1188252 RepID=A0A1E5E4T9_9VIBR|nr:GGDEF domain-containing protein [Vibrio rumoiensis]OEF28141.1 hypothetical protein A1QC_05735 [Vibrio rumoiensis 1S-45]